MTAEKAPGLIESDKPQIAGLCFASMMGPLRVQASVGHERYNKKSTFQSENVQGSPIRR